MAYGKAGPGTCHTTGADLSHDRRKRQITATGKACRMKHLRTPDKFRLCNTLIRSMADRWLRRVRQELTRTPPSGLVACEVDAFRPSAFGPGPQKTLCYGSQNRLHDGSGRTLCSVSAVRVCNEVVPDRRAAGRTDTLAHGPCCPGTHAVPATRLFEPMGCKGYPVPCVMPTGVGGC